MRIFGKNAEKGVLRHSLEVFDARSPLETIWLATGERHAPNTEEFENKKFKKKKDFFFKIAH